MKKTSFYKKLSAVCAMLCIPLVTLAQVPYTTRGQPVPTGPKNLAYLIDLIAYYLNLALGLLMGIAVVMFVFYVIKYFIMPNEDRKQAGQYVMYSVIGFFVILSFWGLVNIVQNTFGLQNYGNNWQNVQSLFPTGK